MGLQLKQIPILQLLILWDTPFFSLYVTNGSLNYKPLMAISASIWEAVSVDDLIRTG